MRWGSPGPNDYQGELTVTGNGGSTLTVTLNTERADGPGIRAGLETTLARQTPRRGKRHPPRLSDGRKDVARDRTPVGSL